LKRIISFLSLFTSVSTLFCCALPALFVVLGFGAAFAGLVGSFPQIVWISEHKFLVFGSGALLLALGGFLQFKSKQLSCPAEPALGEACATTRDWSAFVYWTSVILYLIGSFFAFGIEHFH